MTGGEFQRLFARWTGEAEPGWAAVPPAWLGPPGGELGECVPLSLVVARSERAAVAVSQATAYSSGIALDVAARARGLTEREAHNLLHEQHLFPGEDERSPAFLRVGVELADGTRASNLGPHRPPGDEPSPDTPVLMQTGGRTGSAGDGQTELDDRYWLWPLPPPGQLRIYVEWPALEIPLSWVEVDATVLLDAAARSQRIWDDEE